MGCVDSGPEAEEGLDVAALDGLLVSFNLSADAGDEALPKLEIFWAARNGPGSTFVNCPPDTSVESIEVPRTVDEAGARRVGTGNAGGGTLGVTLWDPVGCHDT